MLPTSPKDQSSISQKRRKYRAGTPSFSQLCTSDLDLHQILQGKKTISEEQSTTLYNLQGDVYFKIANSEDDDQEAPFVRKIDLIRLIQE